MIIIDGIYTAHFYLNYDTQCAQHSHIHSLNYTIHLDLSFSQFKHSQIFKQINNNISKQNIYMKNTFNHKVGSRAEMNLKIKCLFKEMGLKTGFEERDR